VGFKPSYERISRAGVIPLSSSLDHVGAFAADAAGAALAAEILIRDWKLEVGGLGKPVLGVPEGPYLANAGGEMLAHFRATMQRLADAGCRVKAVPAMPDFEAIRQRHNLIVAAEAAGVHAEWFPRFGHLYHARTVELIERGRAASAEALGAALAGRWRLRQELAQLRDVHGLDLWASPSAPGPAPRGLESTGDPVMNLPWTHAGLPSLNLPAGTIGGLPVGLQLAGRWRGDEALLAWAVEVEQRLRNA
jgi:Asp-tRNA(Asn)/Glu-tRNA(Gln) amidotransferase A subunit family amidase